jgi:hypothetical protein
MLLFGEGEPTMPALEAKTTERQSWQDIAQSKGMTYLQRLPEAIPKGQFLVHNSARPTDPLGSQGFRAWLQAQDEHLEPCDCAWTPELGTHYRVKLTTPERCRDRTSETSGETLTITGAPRPAEPQ